MALKEEVKLDPPIFARYIQFRPAITNKENIFLKVQIYGCPMGGNIFVIFFNLKMTTW